MATVVPESHGTFGPAESVSSLGEILEGLLEFTGARAGWVRLRDPDGRALRVMMPWGA